MKRRSENCSPMPKKQSTENVVFPTSFEKSLLSDGNVQYLTSKPTPSRNLLRS